MIIIIFYLRLYTDVRYYQLTENFGWRDQRQQQSQYGGTDGRRQYYKPAIQCDFGNSFVSRIQRGLSQCGNGDRSQNNDSIDNDFTNRYSKSNRW